MDHFTLSYLVQERQAHLLEEAERKRFNRFHLQLGRRQVDSHPQESKPLLQLNLRGLWVEVSWQRRIATVGKQG